MARQFQELQMCLEAHIVIIVFVLMTLYGILQFLQQLGQLKRLLQQGLQAMWTL